MANILVMDDDDDLRKMLREVLTRQGHQVRDVSNGKEALELHRAEPADLVIADIIMPEKDGLETIAELKRDDPDLSIIAISAGGRLEPSDYLDVAQRLGVNCVFRKPLNMAEMVKAVERLID